MVVIRTDRVRPEEAESDPGLDFSGIRTEFALPDGFPAAALAEAERAVAEGVDPAGREDATALPLVTIDPPGSKDLDQALLLQRVGAGFRVHYAIADLGAFVVLDGALDAEVRRRGQTLYLPDGNVPLHPPVLSEGAASLLPGRTRPAVLWTFECGPDGEPTDVRVRRAFVRSTEQFDYEGVRASFDAGTPHPSVEALPDFGRLRRERAADRGAVELQLPEQEIAPNGDGDWKLVVRPRSDVEAWNAEISLLTGMSAARVMLDAGVGVLRTLPDADDGAVDALRRSAHALGVPWPAGVTPAKLLADLDPARPEALALFVDATRLLRGAGYTAFDGEVPQVSTHAGLAAPYAHVTAPLRRLVDRFATEVCLAVTAGEEVPDRLRAALPLLPGLMGGSDALASKVDRACLDQVEAWVLADRVGQVFEAVVLRADDNGADVFVAQPPVMGRCAGEGLREGERVRVTLVEADPGRRKVAFARL
ncbi:RNB domain-containing ribonuclease [Saccharothrix longispora]|uniref:RNB domain-containing ribonuclease n=1 Tax=Saccharothrix longispora TaxID=33920 RepID=UPI0028FD5FAA|nr:RNB domain-containing ribonuclease [Saccharothrix longispora]MBY8849108.1 RNB domain-containing ribonuclease [Saccharothrix sp. MB29]MDU0290566.1 RNB domain-containing ribonuclease [Saccharothrix longispora]